MLLKRIRRKIGRTTPILKMSQRKKKRTLLLRNARRRHWMMCSRRSTDRRLKRQARSRWCWWSGKTSRWGRERQAHSAVMLHLGRSKRCRIGPKRASSGRKYSNCTHGRWGCTRKFVLKLIQNRNCKESFQKFKLLCRLDIQKKAKEYKIPAYVVADAGLTQIKEGSLTVCGLGPAPSKMLNILTSELKLL